MEREIIVRHKKEFMMMRQHGDVTQMMERQVSPIRLLVLVTKLLWEVLFLYPHFLILLCKKGESKY